MDRAEHLAQARARALEHADQGRTVEAIASLTSGLGEHEETAGHPAIETMALLADGKEFAAPGSLRRFIEGVH